MGTTEGRSVGVAAAILSGLYHLDLQEMAKKRLGHHNKVSIYEQANNFEMCDESLKK